MDALLIIVTAIVAGGSAYVGSYLKKKGQNLATHEDIDKLVEQVMAVTVATKEIETRISGDLWDRQKRWEIKRDAFLEVERELASARNALNDLNSAFSAARQFYERQGITTPFQPQELATLSQQGLTDSFLQRKADATDMWRTAKGNWDRAAGVAGLVGGAEVRQSLNEVKVVMSQIASGVISGTSDTFMQEQPKLIVAANMVRLAIRRELGIDATPQPNGPSENPTPDPRSPG